MSFNEILFSQSTNYHTKMERIRLLFSVSCAKLGKTAVRIAEQEGNKVHPASRTNSFNHVKAVS